MPRTYKPNLRGKQYVSDSTEEIQQALKAVSRGLSLRKADEKYKIPKSVLHRHKKGTESNTTPLNIGGQSVLLKAVDNLSSHLSIDAIELCEQNNIGFVFLPSDSTHLTQPLDVAFFAPLKSTRRQIWEKWKRGPGRKQSSLSKEAFPQLLRELRQHIMINARENIVAGFRKAGIIPLNPESVLDRLLPPDDAIADKNLINDSIVSLLKEMRYDGPKATVPKKRINVEPGKSVSGVDLCPNVSGEESEDECQASGNEMSSSSDTDSIPEHEIVEESNYMKRNGLPVTGVYQLSQEKILKENDWIVVDFSECRATSPKQVSNPWFIGMVTDVKNEKKNIEASFVKFTETRINSGSNFNWPEKEDHCLIKRPYVGGLLHPQLL